jgi:MYXO-CTERM domain-containing protein
LRRALYLLGLLFVFPCAHPALADPMFLFTLTGDGSTFQFTTPNPATVTGHPHQIDVFLSGVTGAVDGVEGYTFGATIVAELNLFTSPVLYLNVSPSPSNLQPPYPLGPGNYDLYGPTFTTLVSDLPNPSPYCYPGFTACNDLLTFAFVPGEYSLYGYDPDGKLGNYSLDIATSAASTPEPYSSLLVLMGAAALPAWRRRIG